MGDYAEDGDLPPEFKASTIFAQCQDEGEYPDISDGVCAVLERELEGKFTGDGWRDFQRQ